MTSLDQEWFSVLGTAVVDEDVRLAIWRTKRFGPEDPALGLIVSMLSRSGVDLIDLHTALAETRLLGGFGGAVRLAEMVEVGLPTDAALEWLSAA